MKNNDTPTHEINAPTMARIVIRWPNNQCEGSSISIGVVAIMVDAMPAAVYCTAANDSPTPRNGPEINVTHNAIIAFLS